MIYSNWIATRGIIDVFRLFLIAQHSPLALNQTNSEYWHRFTKSTLCEHCFVIWQLLMTDSLVVLSISVKRLFGDKMVLHSLFLMTLLRPSGVCMSKITVTVGGPVLFRLNKISITQSTMTYNNDNNMRVESKWFDWLPVKTHNKGARLICGKKSVTYVALPQRTDAGSLLLPAVSAHWCERPENLCGAEMILHFYYMS